MTPDDDVVTVLTQQHRQLEARFKALLDRAEAGDAQAAMVSLAGLGDEMAVHILAEEQLVYPAVRVARTDVVLPASLEEHQPLKRLLAELMALDPDDAAFQPTCKALEQLCRGHHEEEEAHGFPALQRLLDAPSRQAMGAAVKAHGEALRASGAPRGRVAAPALP